MQPIQEERYFEGGAIKEVEDENSENGNDGINQDNDGGLESSDGSEKEIWHRVTLDLQTQEI